VECQSCHSDPATVTPTATIHWSQLGVQAHCLRREMAVDFPGTLRRLNSLGLNNIELCCFPGCAGNPWGDFGRLAEWPPERIRDHLEEAGIVCVACHFTPRELTDEAIGTSIRWAKAVGSPVIVLAGFPLTADSGITDWQIAFEGLNRTGALLGGQGLGFAYHTQNDAWATADGVLLFDELLRLTDPGLCAIELDLSGTLSHGASWEASVAKSSHRFLALHLRDGKRPPAQVPYLPALALGEGDTDIKAAIISALQAGARHYLLEMEVEAPRDVFQAIELSLKWLESHACRTG
jgi:hypothetical protein